MDSTVKAKVFDLVANIPKGKVLTYKLVAEICHVANPRIVGRYLHTNLDSKSVPCHRVIRSDGKVASGYAFGGPQKQAYLLEQEGVVFKNNKVDLKKYLWDLSSRMPVG